MKTCAALVMLGISGPALADERVVTIDRTCLEIDARTDGLAPPDREHAIQLMTRVLEREDLLVVADACTETYTLSHEREGDGYVIRLRSPAGKRRMVTPALNELSAKYTRLAHSLVEAKVAPAPEAAAQPAVIENAQEPLPTAAPIMLDAEEPAASAEPRAKRNTWYGTVGAQVMGGAAFGLGYRHNLGRASIDIAYNGRSSDSSGTDAMSIGFELLRNKRLSPNAIGYVGGGLSLGSMSRGEDLYYYGGNSYDYYWGSGLQGELTAGMQLGKARGVQFLAQLDITLPFYRMGNHDGEHDYAGAAVVSGGLGF